MTCTVSEPGGSAEPARLLLFYAAGSSEFFVVLIKTEVEIGCEAVLASSGAMHVYVRSRPW